MNSLYAIDFSNSIRWDESTYSGEVIMSLLVMGLIAILSFVVFCIFRGKDPTKPDRNKFITIMCGFVNWVDGYTIDLMGKKWRRFAAYSFCLVVYIFLSFFIAITGLPGPLTSYTCTLSIGLITLIMIHVTAIKKNKLKYFKRYTDPFPIFLPINLIAMWAPMLSLSLRLFGNALAGFALETLAYYFLEKLSGVIFGGLLAVTPFPGPAGIFLAPLITPALHLYFDLFSGVVQAFIFISLTMVWVAQENPDEEVEEQTSVLGESSKNEPVTNIENVTQKA